ncbi:hypothetical protein PG996_003070 [Apiospora saccharicola]|uniref:2EXR domain-containing protein n=1 Tax=Apiospora saccharicola TaxID=335842 RepID=A0ABR1W080_9PEZI
MAHTHCTEFHLFPSLPPELRRAIWDYVVEEPRVVETCGLRDPKTGREGDRLYVFPKFPPIYNVCHEARKAFVESTGLVSENRGLGVAWHPERDILKCSYILDRSIDFTWWDEIGEILDDFNYSIPRLHKHHEVQNIQFDLSTFFDAYPFSRGSSRRGEYPDCGRTRADILGRFPNLRTVELVADDEYRSPPGEPRLFEVTLNFPHGPIDFDDAWEFINGLRDSRYQDFSLNIVGRMVCRIE